MQRTITQKHVNWKVLNQISLVQPYFELLSSEELIFRVCSNYARQGDIYICSPPPRNAKEAKMSGCFPGEFTTLLQQRKMRSLSVLFLVVLAILATVQAFVPTSRSYAVRSSTIVMDGKVQPNRSLRRITSFLHLQLTMLSFFFLFFFFQPCSTRRFGRCHVHCLSCIFLSPPCTFTRSIFITLFATQLCIKHQRILLHRVPRPSIHALLSSSLPCYSVGGESLIN